MNQSYSVNEIVHDASHIHAWKEINVFCVNDLVTDIKSYHISSANLIIKYCIQNIVAWAYAFNFATAVCVYTCILTIVAWVYKWMLVW